MAQVKLRLLRHKKHDIFIDDYHQGRGTIIPIIKTHIKI